MPERPRNRQRGSGRIEVVGARSTAQQSVAFRMAVILCDRLSRAADRQLVTADHQLVRLPKALGGFDHINENTYSLSLT
ncbi:hypothetical protein [Rhizobium sp.]|uniref:hypothetical protein n=1 Tax=Rhizobium sp. TaxID=391 RepID=UPI0028A5AD0D